MQKVQEIIQQENGPVMYKGKQYSGIFDYVREGGTRVTILFPDITDEENERRKKVIDETLSRIKYNIICRMTEEQN